MCLVVVFMMCMVILCLLVCCECVWWIDGDVMVFDVVVNVGWLSVMVMRDCLMWFGVVVLRDVGGVEDVVWVWVMCVIVIVEFWSRLRCVMVCECVWWCVCFMWRFWDEGWRSSRLVDVKLIVIWLVNLRSVWWWVVLKFLFFLWLWDLLLLLCCCVNFFCRRFGGNFLRWRRWVWVGRRVRIRVNWCLSWFFWVWDWEWRFFLMYFFDFGDFLRIECILRCGFFSVVGETSCFLFWSIGALWRFWFFCLCMGFFLCLCVF